LPIVLLSVRSARPAPRTGRDHYIEKIPGPHALAETHGRLPVRRQIDVDPRPETDHPYPLARGERLAGGDAADDAPRHETGDQREAQPAVSVDHSDRHALVVLRRIVTVRGEKPTGRALDALHPSADR
jgi:hypothetical protein